MARVTAMMFMSTPVGREAAAGSILGTVQNGVDIRVCERISADDTLIISIVIENYPPDHMFTKCRFHCDNYWTTSVDNSAIGYADFSANQELKQLLVQRAFY
uniref:Uncharacterized protein n=1 Tax=Romanomermis culicivorax TaxID=13658 RepID=A0A915JNF9_ROMCU